MSNIPFNIIILFTLFSIDISLATLISNVFLAHDYTKLAPQAFGVITQSILIYYFARGSETARRILGALSVLGLLFLTFLAYVVSPDEAYLRIIGLIYLMICAYQAYCLFFSVDLRDKLESQRSFFGTEKSKDGASFHEKHESEFRKLIINVILYSAAFITLCLAQLYFYRTDFLSLIGLLFFIFIASIISLAFGFITNNKIFNRQWIPISIFMAIIGISFSLTLDDRKISDNVKLFNDEFTKDVVAQNNDWRLQKISASLGEIDSEKCRGRDSFNAPDQYTKCEDLFNQHVIILRELQNLSTQFYNDQSSSINRLAERLLKKYELPREYKVNFTNGLSVRIKTNRDNSEKLINGYLNLDAEYASLFNFLAKHKDNLEKSDGNIKFKDDSNIELFNARIKRIQDLGNELSKINESINAVKN